MRDARNEHREARAEGEEPCACHVLLALSRGSCTSLSTGAIGEIRPKGSISDNEILANRGDKHLVTALGCPLRSHPPLGTFLSRPPSCSFSSRSRAISPALNYRKYTE